MTNEIVLYRPNEQFQLEVQVMDDTVWLTQQQMAQLFGVAENNITYHIRGIYKAQELESAATTQKIRVVRRDCIPTQRCPVLVSFQERVSKDAFFSLKICIYQKKAVPLQPIFG